MFGPDDSAGCPSCSAIADGIDGLAVHLSNHDVTLTCVSRAPLAKLAVYKKRMGWRFAWAAAQGEFNYDFNVSFTEEQQRVGDVEYNYRRGTDAPKQMRDLPGMSAFFLDHGVVYHTYSTYARGLDGLWGMYQWLDRAPKGRNENGRWLQRHDEYAHG